MSISAESHRDATAPHAKRADGPLSTAGRPVAGIAPRPVAGQTRKPISSPEQAKSRRVTPAGIFAVLAFVALVMGWYFPLQRYITPERGIGYALGITGASLMLLLLLYSARKHFRWLAFLGPVARWFRFHMILGILGPLCILYHSNFSLGAVNSNVALLCMLTVAGSGLIGRYIYSRIHLGLYGRKLSMGELRDSADGLRALSGTIGFLPQLVIKLEVCERKLLATGPSLPVLGFAKPAFVGAASLVSRWQLHSYIRRALRVAARTSPTVAAEKKRLGKAARSYVDKRLLATRRVAEFQAYERLFSLWHALHLPLIFMLVMAAVVHIVAVNVY